MSFEDDFLVTGLVDNCVNEWDESKPSPYRLQSNSFYEFEEIALS